MFCHTQTDQSNAQVEKSLAVETTQQNLTHELLKCIENVFSFYDLS